MLHAVEGCPLAAAAVLVMAYLSIRTALAARAARISAVRVEPAVAVAVCWFIGAFPGR